MRGILEFFKEAIRGDAIDLMLAVAILFGVYAFAWSVITIALRP